MNERGRLCVVGGGPAGLRAAEVASAAGANVAVFDAMPSVGRKFLVAGRGGLNITRIDADFAARYSGPGMPENLWEGLIAEFGPDAAREWVEGLGVETFVGSGRRVYPAGMKAAPLLRRWVGRLRAQGVEFFPRHRWSGLAGPRTLEFETPSGAVGVEAGAVVLALGGGSWPSTGSDGGWVGILRGAGVDVAALEPSNCGWECAWTEEFLAAAEGQPLKNVSIHAGGQAVAGEILITGYGLEGGPVYALTPELRKMAEPVLHIDLKPAFSFEELLRRMPEPKRFHIHEAAERWRLGQIARALLANYPLRAEWNSVSALASAVKAYPVRLTGSRPLAEAISSAGGVRWSGVDDCLMLRARPGIFVAGEMLDWEAPTGGYLIQGCLATGTRAGRAAAKWMEVL